MKWSLFSGTLSFFIHCALAISMLLWLFLTLVLSCFRLMSCITYDPHTPVFHSYTVFFFTLVVVLCFLLLLSLAVLDSCTALSFTLTSLSNLVLHCIVFYCAVFDSFTVLFGLFIVMSLTLSLALCCLDSVLCCLWFLHCVVLALYCAVFDSFTVLSLITLCCCWLFYCAVFNSCSCVSVCLSLT